jgi:hypothetical protein
VILAAVVDADDLEVNVVDGFERGHDLREECGDRLFFVVERYDERQD